MTAEAFLVASPNTFALRALNYAPGIDRFRTSRGHHRSNRLGDLISELGGSFGTVFTRIDCEAAYGVPLYAQVDTFSAEPEGRTIRRDAMPRPDRQAVQPWQILIAAAGQMAEGNLFGRSIIADSRLTSGYCGPDTLALTFDPPGSEHNLWTYAFLNTNVGLRAIRACAYGTSIPRLRPDLIMEIPIPQADEQTRKRVATLVRRAVEQRELYGRELRASRAVIESLPEMQAAHALCAERKPRATIWEGELRSLCAWNVASVGAALGDLQRAWGRRLADAIVDDGIFYGPRFARISCSPPHGVDFMSQRDLFLVRPLPRRIAHPGFDDTKLFVPEDTLMIGAQGTLGEGEIFGRTALIRGQLSHMAYTQHLLRVLPQPRMAASLYAYLSTLVGMRLLRSTGVGTKLLSMREDLLRELPLPDLTDEQTATVTRHVDAAHSARDAATEAEARAISIVEEVLSAWPA